MTCYNPGMFALFATLMAAAILSAPPDIAAIEATIGCKRFAPANCPALKTLLDAGPSALPAILDALDDPRQPLRLQAARIAGYSQLGPASDRAASLLVLLDKTAPEISGEIVDALGRIGHPMATTRVQKLLASPDTDGRTLVFAANALGRLKGQGSLTALVKLMGHAMPRVQQAGAANLGRLGDTAAVAPLINRAIAEQVPRFVRAECARSLALLGDMRAVAPLVLLLARRELDVRTAAARALAALKSPQSVGPLVALLRGDADLAPEIIVTLAAIDDKAATLPLVTLVTGNGHTVAVRQKGLWALAQLKDVAAIDGVVRVLQGKNAKLARLASETLGQIGSDRAIPALMAAMEFEDQTVARGAIWALQTLTGLTHSTADAWSAWAKDAR